MIFKNWNLRLLKLKPVYIPENEKSLYLKLILIQMKSKLTKC